jgi:hypothetical protein
MRNRRHRTFVGESLQASPLPRKAAGFTNIASAQAGVDTKNS